MSDKEHIEYRHPTRGRDSTRAAAVKAFADANEESGFGRRTVIRNSLIAALAASVLPGITLFRGLAPQDEDPVDAAEAHDVDRGHAPRARPRGHPDPRRRPDPRLRRPRHPRVARRAEPRGGLPRGEGQGHRAAHAPAPRGPQRDAGDAPAGRTTASSRTRRSARTSDAPSRSTSSRRTTCCAPATSRSSTWRTTRPSSSDRPPDPCRSFRSPWTTRATSSPRVTSTNPSARASGSVTEIEHRNRQRREPSSSPSATSRSAAASSAPRRTTSTSARASPGFVKELGRKIFPDHWSFMLGEIALWSFVVVLLSGTFLTFFFQASMVETHYTGNFAPMRGIEMSAALESSLRSRSTSAAGSSSARSTTGRRSCSSPASACTCCACSSPARSASRASSTG